MDDNTTSPAAVFSPAPEPGLSSSRWASRPLMVVLIIVFGLVKAVTYASLLHHPITVLVVCGLVGVLALRHGRLITTAVAWALFTAVAIPTGSVVAGIAVGAGAFIAIMTLFVMISTVLHVVDAAATRRSDRLRHGWSGAA